MRAQLMFIVGLVLFVILPYIKLKVIIRSDVRNLEVQLEPKEKIKHLGPPWIYTGNVDGVLRKLTWDFKARPSQGCYDNMKFRNKVIFNCLPPIDVSLNMTLHNARNAFFT